MQHQAGQNRKQLRSLKSVPHTFTIFQQNTKQLKHLCSITRIFISSGVLSSARQLISMSWNQGGYGGGYNPNQGGFNPNQGGMNTNAFNPGMNTNAYNPGMNPGMNTNAYHPGMNTNTYNPGMNPNFQPGMNTNAYNPGMNTNAMNGQMANFMSQFANPYNLTIPTVQFNTGCPRCHGSGVINRNGRTFPCRRCYRKGGYCNYCYGSRTNWMTGQPCGYCMNGNYKKRQGHGRKKGRGGHGGRSRSRSSSSDSDW